MQPTTVRIERPDDINFILGQTHFIKTVEDALASPLGVEAEAGIAPSRGFPRKIGYKH